VLWVGLNFSVQKFSVGASNIVQFPENISSNPMFVMKLLIVLMCVVTQVGLKFEFGT
jgi:hypothetical protein